MTSTKKYWLICPRSPASKKTLSAQNAPEYLSE